MRSFSLVSGIVLVVMGCAASQTSGLVDSDGGVRPAVATSGNYPTADAFCAKYCGRVQACDNAADTQTCTNSCVNTSAAVFPKLRPDVVDAIAACFDAKDCKAVLGGSVVGACANEAVASVAPSAVASQYCDELDAAGKKCGKPRDKASCLNTAKLYNDGALAGARACASKSCADVDACVSAALGGFGMSSVAADAGREPSTCSLSGTSGRSACDACLRDTCCAQANACFSNGSCRSVLTCVTSCGGGSACTQQCFDSYPSGASAASSLYACEATCADPSACPR
jgi:hypothetical protein